jgi:transaldolase
MNRAAFLDRDGVINRTVVVNGRPYPPASLETLEILPGVPEAIRIFRHAGFRVLVVTNQPDVATGRQSRAVVEAMHAYLRSRLDIDDIFVCYHTDAHGCACRKPRPGMLLQAAEEWSLDLAESFMVGDRWRDVEAGRRAGCKAIWVRGEEDYDEPPPQAPDGVARSLLEASALICPKFRVARPVPPSPRGGTGGDLMAVPADLHVKLFADGANPAGIAEMANKTYISGFTTNPTLMRKANVKDYRGFAREVLGIIGPRPISFEVFSDDFAEMELQAREIASWGANVYVKIPVTNTRGEFAGPLIRKLAGAGVQVNVTALMTLEQVRDVGDCLVPQVQSCVSVFAGRIADTGRDPMPIMRKAVNLLRPLPRAELIWASPRELLNVFQANEVGCHIITATNDILQKLSLVGKDLDAYSLETVHMFFNDARAAGFTIDAAAGRRKVA